MLTIIRQMSSLINKTALRDFHNQNQNVCQQIYKNEKLFITPVFFFAG